ncbi:hypothetical protein V8C43DRAFT_328276 [Trichoderma afarasin]
MENHLNGNAFSPEHTEDVHPRIEAMMLQTNTWLRQIATRLDALEAPAVINNAQMPIDNTQQPQNDNRITAVKARMSALIVNMERRTQNANWYRAKRTPDTILLPLIDLRTGGVIDGFPGTVADLSRLDENAARNILDALEISHQGYDADSVREVVRFYVYYA